MKAKIKILVVDDDPSLLDLLVETLETIGYFVYGALGAEKALEILKTSPVQLLITDIKMPGMSGLDLASTVKREYPGLPIIFITGVFTDSIMTQIDTEPVLTKPFRISQIEETIKKAIQPSKASGEHPRSILVVDDDSSFRLMLMETLKLSEYSVVGASGAKEALKIIKRGGIGTVIADINMPDIDGQLLARRIKNDWPEIPVILITAYLTSGEQQDHNDIADGFLMKPFKVEHITDLLENLKKN